MGPSSSRRAFATTGERLGERYRIDERIGTGGMADVYRATDLRLERTVAIKVVNPLLSEISDAALRFFREARVMAALDAPELVPIYDVGIDGDRLFLVQKLLRGEPLAECMERGPVPIADAVPIVCRVLSGLEPLHRAGLVHRDVKPANVFLTTNGRVRLLDLGLVIDETERQHITDRGVVLGTPEYMAPEQALGEPLDVSSDLYSAGLVLLHAIQGRSDAEIDSSVQARIRGDAWLEPCLEGVPSHLRSVLRTALARNPRDRFQCAADMRTALSASAREPLSTAAVLRGHLQKLPRLEAPTRPDAPGARIAQEHETTSDAPGGVASSDE